METKLIDNQEYIKLSDLYEWTISRMDKLTLEEQKQTLRNLQEIIKLKHIVSSKEIAEAMIENMIQGILNNTMPLDPMSISYICFRCKELGVDPHRLTEVVDSNAEFIVEEFFKNLNQK